MSEIVVDASVAAKWVLNEDYSLEAGRLLDGRALCAPSHWLAEAINVVWSYVRRGDILAPQAAQGAGFLMRAPISPIPLDGLIQQALMFSNTYAVTVYDSLYLALAKQRNIAFATDDRKLIRKLRGSADFDVDLIWVADL